MVEIQVLWLSLMAGARDRVRRVLGSADRGAGGNSLEILLLVIAGLIVVGIVTAVIAARVNSEKDKVGGQ